MRDFRRKKRKETIEGKTNFKEFIFINTIFFLISKNSKNILDDNYRGPR